MQFLVRFCNFVVMDVRTLAERLAERTGRDAEDMEVMISALSALIVNRVKEGDAISIPSFGTFEPKFKAERITTHPSSGKKLLVPPKLALLFKPSAMLRQKIRKS